MSSNVPDDRRYTPSHEWVQRQADGSIAVGITDHAQHALGDLVFVEVPTAGRRVAVGEACAVVESVKAASDVYSPIAGDVLEGNAELAATPERINTDPYGAGWLWKLKPTNAADLEALLDARAYIALLAAAAD